jgi:hypothetical protein
MDTIDVFELNQRINDIVGGKHQYYIGDMGAAMTLLDSVDYEHTPRLVRMLGSTGHYWKCAILSNSHGNDFEVTEETAALAICKAFVDYRAAHTKGGAR